MADKTRIAIAIGDPAGIGPEISLKAARDASVRHACRPLLVGDARVLQRHAAACRFPVDLHAIGRIQDADWSAECVNVLDCVQTGLAAFELVTRERVARVIAATERALRRMGTAVPKLAVGGLNPHAGEGGLFGREEIEIIKPAIDAAAGRGLAVTGPFGADTLFHRQAVDAFIVMLHDQGHIPAKLLARNAVAAMTIGSPV